MLIMRAVRWCGNRRLQGGNRLQTVSEVRGRGAAPFKVRHAVRDHWVLVLTPVIVLMAVAGVFAFQRTPTYTAESRLTLGQLDVAAQAPSYVTAAQGLEPPTRRRSPRRQRHTAGRQGASHHARRGQADALLGHPGGSDTLFLIDAKDRPRPKRSSCATPLRGRWCATWDQARRVGRRRRMVAWRRTGASTQQHRTSLADRARAGGLRAHERAARRALARTLRGPTRPSYARRCSTRVYGDADGWERRQHTPSWPRPTRPRAITARWPGSCSSIAALAGLWMRMALAVRIGTRPVEEPARQVRSNTSRVGQPWRSGRLAAAWGRARSSSP